MAIDKVIAHLDKLGLAGRVQQFDVSSATVALAAQALGCEGARIAKTLSFLLEGDRPMLLVAAGDAKIDNAKYKAQFHAKARMIPAERVEAMIGHGVGGVCPFGVDPDIPVYLDASLRRFETVYPACGSANSAVELTLPELEAASGSRGWVDVCKGWA